MAAVAEINHHPNHQPDCQPEPRDPGQAQHHDKRSDDSQDWDQRRHTHSFAWQWSERAKCGQVVKPVRIAAIITALRIRDMHPHTPRILAMTSSRAKTRTGICRGQHKSSRKGERGVTIVIVAVGMISLLAMAVLAIDVVTLYVASGQAQQTEDAAALAGAAAFSSSGFTSAPSIVPQSSVCNGSTGDADMRAQAIAAKFKIGGTAPTSVATSCN